MINKELLIETINLIKENHLTIGTVESFTGGLYASSLTSISGVSSIFLGSIVSYNECVKENLVGVKESTIKKYSVVSKEVAYEMAFYGHDKLNTDIVISFTGNAGPTVCEGDKPVGLFYIGLYFKGAVETYEFKLDLPRNELREEAINLINKIILKKLGKK